MRRTIVLLTLIIAVSSLARSQTTIRDNHSESIATHRCIGSQLSVKHESDDAGVGQRDVTYSFKNRSSSPCMLSGFPSFVLLNRRGQRIHGQSTSHNGEPVTVVRLAPGGKAYFNIHYSACGTVGTPPCRTSYNVRIKAPHDTRSFILREELDPFQLSVDLSPVKSSAP
jgi:hypothetical protein